MNRMDMRFDRNLVQSFVGQQFKKYRCDEFVFTNSVTQIVGIYIGDSVIKLSNEQEAVDYFGNKENIAIFKIMESKDSEIVSAFLNTEQKDNPVNGIIDEIILVEENQQVFERGSQTYDVWLTRGIIFNVDGREISFEKQNVPFSEEINIQRGDDLIGIYGDVGEFSEEWSAEIKAIATREIITFNREVTPFC